MFIVYYFETEKHSIWKSKQEAEHQIEVLENHGYNINKMWIEHIETSQYENGHYFV